MHYSSYTKEFDLFAKENISLKKIDFTIIWCGNLLHYYYTYPGKISNILTSTHDQCPKFLGYEKS